MRDEKTAKRDDLLFHLQHAVVLAEMLIKDIDSGELDIEDDPVTIAMLMGLVQRQLNLAWHCRAPGPRLQDRDGDEYDDLAKQIPQWEGDERLVDPFAADNSGQNG